MSSRRLIVALVLCTTLAACGGSPSAPSSGGLLQGTWRGTLTIQPDTSGPSSGPTTWTFTDIPGGSGHGYTATIQSPQQGWFAPTATANAVLVDSQFQADGSYASPRGCSAVFFSFGTADAHTVKATFHGVDCGTVTFTGSVELSR